MIRFIILFILIATSFIHVQSQNVISSYYFELNHPYTDGYLCSTNNYGNYHLIGTYPGFDKTAIYIAGYNNSNMPSVTTQKVYIGQKIRFDLNQNSLHLESLNSQGILIGNYRDKLNWNGTGEQPGYHIRFAGYRDVAGDVTGARISALRSAVCCDGLYQGMELAFSVTNSIEWQTQGDVNLREAMRINSNGRVAIGKVKAESALDVAGTIMAQEIQVKAATTAQLNVDGTLHANAIKVAANGQTADFVFEAGYDLKDLADVETFIKEHKHLPNIPSASEMEANGMDLAEMNKLLLQKVEELTLYIIDLEAKNENEKSERASIETRISQIEALLRQSKK